MIQTTYPDRICYHPRCDVHKCLVLLPDGVAPDRGVRRASSWGIRMELLRIAMRAPCHQGKGSLHLAHADSPPCDVPPSPDILHSEFYPANVPPSLDISHPALDAGWERRTFQLPRTNMFGSSNSAYPESFFLSIQCRDVLLKLPDMCDRHFEIFFFRYLMSNPESLLVTHLS